MFEPLAAGRAPRRAVLLMPLAFAGLLVVSSRRDRPLPDARRNGTGGRMKIVLISDNGRQRETIEVNKTVKSEAEWQRAFQLYQGFNEAKGVGDLIVSLEHLRAVPQCSGKAGSVGYCLGGKLAYLMATRSNADASVGYYGVGIEKALGEAAAITKPLLLHIAAKDQFCPPEAQAEINASLGRNSHVTLHTYPGVDHAFARVGGGHYDKAAADLANRRTAEFFTKHLG